MRIVSLLGLITALCFQTVSAKTLVYCSEGAPETFNPQLGIAGTTFDASSRQVYNRLFEFKIGTTETQPGLAESFEVNEDGTVYTFNLRKGVKFHTTKFFKPTRDFNADDVLFTFNRQRDKSHPYHKVSGGVYKYYYDMGMDKLIKEINKIDEHTVEFVLTRPESPFIANLAMDFASILSKEYGDSLIKKGKMENIDQKPIGTGPFQFKRYKKDAFIRYTAHPEYWRGKEDIDKLVFAITVDPTVRLAKLKKGECHVMSYPIPSQLEELRKAKGIDLQEQPGLNIGYWAFNLDKPPFDNHKVRKALSHAINRDDIANAIFGGNALVAKNFIPPTLWSYNNDVPVYEYNPDRAKDLLKEAGFENGFEMELWAMPVQRPYNPNARKMAEIMQANLEDINVKAKIVSFEWGTYLKKARDGEHQTMLIGWTGDNGDPDNFFSPLLSCDAAKAGGNYSRWCHEGFDNHLTKARMTADTDERIKHYKAAQQIIKEEVPVLNIAHSVRFQAKRDNVEGLKVDPLGGIYFSNVSLN